MITEGPNDKPESWASRARLRSLAKAGAIWLSITAAFMAYRASDFYVWDDSPAVMTEAEYGGWANVAQRITLQREWFSAHPLRFTKNKFSQMFDHVGGNGYRPLSWVQTEYARLLMEASGTSPWHLAVWGAIYATFALTLYFVAKRFVQLRSTAILAVILVLCSPPCVAASWVIIAGLQILVPLWICASLLLYWHATEGRTGRSWSTLTLCGLMLLGPWFREFLGIIPVLIGCLEFLRARRPTRLMGIAGLFLAHAVFPTALVKVLFFPELPFVPVSRIGSLGSQMSSSAIRWHAGWHFIPLFPPLLILIAGLGTFFRDRDRDRADEGLPKASRWGRIVQYSRPGAAWLWAATSTICLIMFPEMTPVVLCLGVAVVGLQQNLFLALWFLLSFLPILRVFTEHVHFLYAVVPASIILSGALERLWFVAKEQTTSRLGISFRLRRSARWAIPALGVFFAADQSMNLYGSWKVIHAQYAGMQVVSDALWKHVPRGSAVVGNVIHLDEIKWLTNSHFQAYYSIRSGITNPARAVDTDELRELLVNRGERPVYFLDCDFNHLPHKAPYHRHRFVHHARVETADLGEIHVTRAVYPFLDPLRHFLSAEYVPFLGPPDLVDDFYRGREMQPRLFCLEMYAKYHLYRVEGEDIEAWSPQFIRLVESHDEFNVLTDGTHWVAIPQRDGPFDIDRLYRRDYHPQFVGKTLEDVRRQLRDLKLADAKRPEIE